VEKNETGVLKTLSEHVEVRIQQTSSLRTCGFERMAVVMKEFLEYNE
jgi:hypothetical protein